MQKVILLKYGEIVLKGLNRAFFDRLLLNRVKAVLQKFDSGFKTEYAQSTLYIRSRGNADMDAVAAALTKVFGITSICLSIECEKDMEKIQAVITDNINSLLDGKKTFKCNAKRSDKSFPFKSPEISSICGGVIMEKVPGIAVDVINPEVIINIEIREKSAFVHNGGKRGAGGMPTGSNGRALLLLSGGIDSPVAGHMVAKRGVGLDAVYFESPPYTGEMAREKVKSLCKKLSEYAGKIYLNTISLTDIQTELVRVCEEKYFTLLLRRFMMRLAEKCALIIGANALITGESIGQVASQTILSLGVTDDAVKALPIFRPCIGLDKQEIVDRATHISTLEISQLPYEDCCTVFIPKHPNTRPTIEQIAEQEAKLDIEAMVEKAFLTRQTIIINPD